MITALLLSLLAQNPNCQLPKYTAPKEYQQCNKHDDCTIASDACRTCENIIPVNKGFQAQATLEDLTKRLESKCVKKCEPCNPALIRLRCIDRLCVADKIKPQPEEAPPEEKKAEPAKKVEEPKKATPAPAPQPAQAPAPR